MDLRQLRYFSAVYEHRKLSQAAQTANIAQSAISHHLLNLELELGVRLFDRLPRGMQPTASGTRLYEHAQAILRSVTAATEDLKLLSSEVSGEIQLGLPFTVVEAIGVDLITRFREAYPKARLILHESLSFDLHRQLLTGEHDLIFCYNPPRHERVIRQIVLEEELCCIGQPKYLGIDGELPIDFKEMALLPHIILRRGDGSRSVLPHAWMLDSLYDHAVLEINSVNGARKALAAGIGVIVCPKVTVRDLLMAGLVVARPIVNPASRRPLHLARLAERQPTNLMEAVQSLSLLLIREQLADGTWGIPPDDAAISSS